MGTRQENHHRPAGGTIRIGVDFGTTHTIVAWVDDGNTPVLTLPFEYEGEVLSAELVPSCITVHRGRWYFGPAAIRRYHDHFGQGAVLIPSLKRVLQGWHIGQTIRAGDENPAVEDLLTGFLTEIRRAVLAALDLEAAAVEAVIAVPANAPSSQRYVTLHCFRNAGFRVIRILDEPVASGIQFVRERYKRWDRVKADVVIYDLGGGTFDTTLLSIDGGAFDPVLTQGISRLGGDDFDQVLLELVEARIGDKFNDRERLDLSRAVRDVKEAIGPYTQKLHVETPRGTAAIPIKEFHDAVRPLMHRTIDLVDRVLSDAGEDQAPDRIVLVGGGTLLAAVPKMLRERYGRHKIHQGVYPFASVAIGAAIHAGSPELEVLDRLTNHFGVIRVREDGKEYIDVIFEKGIALPATGRVLTVERPRYDPRFNIGKFRYLECSDLDVRGPVPAGDVIPWNEVFFPYDRAVNPDGEAPGALDPAEIRATDELRGERIREEYSLDEYGIVTARISRTVQDGFSTGYNLYRQYP